MPNIIIRIPEGVLDTDSKAQLVAEVNRTATDVEQMPAEPKSSAMCWVVIEEIAEGNWTCGGVDVTAQVVPVIIQVFIPAGLLDAKARSRYATGLHRAVTGALRDDKRRILISSIFGEVEEGHWGVNDQIWSLADFARHAGFLHLQHLVSR